MNFEWFRAVVLNLKLLLKTVTRPERSRWAALVQITLELDMMSLNITSHWVHVIATLVLEVEWGICSHWTRIWINRDLFCFCFLGWGPWMMKRCSSSMFPFALVWINKIIFDNDLSFVSLFWRGGRVKRVNGVCVVFNVEICFCYRFESDFLLF